MHEGLRRHFRRFVLGAAALAVVGGTATAAIIWSPGAVTLPETSPGAALFDRTFVINTSPFGFGDTIDAVEVGRDDRSPYVALYVTFGPFSPHTVGGIEHPCYLPGWGFDPEWGIPRMPPPWDGPGAAPFPMIDCSIGSRVTPPFIYRPTNDPLHPGWTTNPGSAGQLEDALAACHAFAEEVRSYIASNGSGVAIPTHTPAFPQTAPPGSATSFPTIVLETVWNTAAGTLSQGGVPASPYYLEFYKFRVQTMRDW